MRTASIPSNIARDFRACLERDPAAANWLEVLLAYPGLHAVTAHRFIHVLYRWRIPVLPRLLSHWNRFLTGIEIHPGATIGGGLFIDHGMGVVIGETAEIGDDCTLYQGVTLGGVSLQRGKRHPTLEDGVVVGAGGKVIGAITIGAHSRVAAGAVVVHDVPPNCTVVGVPGRIVMQDGVRVEIAPPSTPPHEEMPDPTAQALAACAERIAELEAKLAQYEGSHGASPV